MFNHLLIPTDGSPLSTLAVDKGLTFARDTGAKVTVLSVFEPFEIFTPSPEQLSSTREEYEKYARMETARALSDAQFKAKSLGVTCFGEQVESDEPYEAIISTAQAKGCDLIVMASHGRRGINALILGSVTTKVLTHSKIPVLVFR